MLLDEVYTCFTYLKGLDYNAIWNMPTYRRRYFLVKRQNEIIDAEESQGGGSTSRSTGNGSKSTTYSGLAAKSWAKKNKENL
jgi:hypothetical protein